MNILAMLLVVLPPCHLWDTGAEPLLPGITFFQVQNSEWVSWCHAPYGTSEVVLDVKVTDTKAKGCAFLYPKTFRTPGGDVLWPAPPTEAALCWKRRTREKKARVTVKLGLDWIPPDMSLYLRSEAPTHLSFDIVESK